jgi:hypothetical protein
MRKRAAWSIIAAGVTAGILLVPGSANAAVLVNADASSSGTSVFGRIGTGNCAEGNISVVSDPQRGRVFRFHKPSSGNRCEHRGYRGFTFRNNTTYHIGWWFKLSNTGNNNAIFQWKSYESHRQNFPIVLKMVDGRLTMLHSPLNGGDRNIWRSGEAIRTNTWYHVVLSIHTNDNTNERGGWVEMTFNGQRITFTTGGQRFVGRTWDSLNDAKMGVYGARGRDVSNFIDGVRVATTYAEAAAT